MDEQVGTYPKLGLVLGRLVARGETGTLAISVVNSIPKGNWPGTLLSKSEIIESQNAPAKGERPKELFTRHWGRATVKLPNGDPLVVHSAHLYPTAEPTVRLKEIRAMIESMKRRQAEPLMVQALAIFHTSLGNEHPNTQKVMRNYQLLLQAMGLTDDEAIAKIQSKLKGDVQ